MLGLEELSNRRAGGDRWHRTRGEDQERLVQNRQARRTDGKNAGNLANRPWLHNPNHPPSNNETDPIWPGFGFAPEPSGVTACTEVLVSASSLTQSGELRWQPKGTKGDGKPVRWEGLV